MLHICIGFGAFLITFLVIMTTDNYFVHSSYTLTPLQSKIFYIANAFFIIVLCTVLLVYLIDSNSKKNLELLRMALSAEKMKKHVVASEYQSLKSQMNPHFLFNSLNVLVELVYINQKDAARFIMELSDVYRYVLDVRDKEVIDLNTEINFINSYTYLLKIRFDNGLVLKNSIQENEKKIMMVPLSLQTLVENAIKHNIVSQTKPLTISICIKEDYIVVENNLQKKPAERQSGIGLDNLKSRYSFLTDKPVLIIQEDKKFIAKIPLLKAPA